MVFTITGSGQPTYTPVTESYQFQVTVSGLAPITGELAVHHTVKQPYKTLLVFQGGGGVSFRGSGGIASIKLLQGLWDRGFHTVDVKWGSGWWQDGTGVSTLLQAARGPQVIEWVRSRWTGWLGALGTSGGASVLAYALGHYGSGEHLSGVLMENGPVHTQLHFLNGNVEWTACTVGSLLAGLPYECGSGQPPCSDPSTYSPYYNGVSIANLMAWSILNGSEVKVYPKTRVTQVMGLKDCNTFAGPAGRAYYNALVGSTRMRIVYLPGGLHGLPVAPGGPGDPGSELIWAEANELAVEATRAHGGGVGMGALTALGINQVKGAK